MKIKAIITGATGMVGEGVLLECLENPAVEQVLAINRRPGGRSHPKLREVIHTDFFDLSAIEAELNGYNACFFCLGISSVGVSKEEYRHLTYDLTISVAKQLAKLNPDLTFCYVTGAGTDSSEQGSVAWARVKGATENALTRVFKRAYMFRPAFIEPTAGQKQIKTLFKVLIWLYPLGKSVYPKAFCTVQQIGRAMIKCADQGYEKTVLEVADIVELANRKTGL